MPRVAGSAPSRTPYGACRLPGGGAVTCRNLGGTAIFSTARLAAVGGNQAKTVDTSRNARRSSTIPCPAKR